MADPIPHKPYMPFQFLELQETQRALLKKLREEQKAAGPKLPSYATSARGTAEASLYAGPRPFDQRASLLPFLKLPTPAPATVSAGEKNPEPKGRWGVIPEVGGNRRIWTRESPLGNLYAVPNLQGQLVYENPISSDEIAAKALAEKHRSDRIILKVFDGKHFYVDPLTQEEWPVKIDGEHALDSKWQLKVDADGNTFAIDLQNPDRVVPIKKPSGEALQEGVDSALINTEFGFQQNPKNINSTIPTKALQPEEKGVKGPSKFAFTKDVKGDFIAQDSTTGDIKYSVDTATGKVVNGGVEFTPVNIGGATHWTRKNQDPSKPDVFATPEEQADIARLFEARKKEGATAATKFADWKQGFENSQWISNQTLSVLDYLSKVDDELLDQTIGAWNEKGAESSFIRPFYSPEVQEVLTRLEFLQGLKDKYGYEIARGSGQITENERIALAAVTLLLSRKVGLEDFRQQLAKINLIVLENNNFNEQRLAAGVEGEFGGAFLQTALRENMENLFGATELKDWEAELKRIQEARDGRDDDDDIEDLDPEDDLPE